MEFCGGGRHARLTGRVIDNGELVVRRRPSRDRSVWLAGGGRELMVNR